MTGYNLRPGCSDSDIPGNYETHHDECPCHEDNDVPENTECMCFEIAQDERAYAAEFRLDCLRDDNLDK